MRRATFCHEGKHQLILTMSLPLTAYEILRQRFLKLKMCLDQRNREKNFTEEHRSDNGRSLVFQYCYDEILRISKNQLIQVRLPMIIQVDRETTQSLCPVPLTTCIDVKAN